MNKFEQTFKLLLEDVHRLYMERLPLDKKYLGCASGHNKALGHLAKRTQGE